MPVELDKIDDIIAQYTHNKSSTAEKSKSDSTSALAINAGQVLTVRSNVEGGQIRQLFTGLRKQPTNNVKLEEIDIRRLPSGFDVVDATAFDDGQQTARKDRRTFGEVFRQQRNARQLELPTSSRASQSHLLRFTKPFEDPVLIPKDDYRLAALGAGSWLEYSAPDSDQTKPASHKPETTIKDAEALFTAVFSSFAPSEDNTTAIIPRLDRSRLWYRKRGSAALRKIVPDSFVEVAPEPTDYPEIDDDFQQLIDEYVPLIAEEAQSTAKDEADGGDSLLDEVSELLQSLASYQSMRDLDKNRVPNTPVKPSSPEMDTFELLRQQLQTLVAILPPFAVAKLDGDQLQTLNISTKILLQTPDIPGTAQPDEGTIHRLRQVQAQQTAASRPIVPPPVRNSYTNTGTPAATYNAQARNYNANTTQTPSMPGYAQRGVQMYNTPRPSIPAAPSFNRTPAYPRAQQPYPGATIQQYQRLQNGYGPTQNNTQYGRSASPAKPMSNGQSYNQQTPQPPAIQPQRNQYSTPAPNVQLLQGAYAQANAHATIQQVKAAAQMQAQHSQSQSPQPQPIQLAQQRQASGTPQPQSMQGMQNSNNAAVNGMPVGAQDYQQRQTLTPQPVRSTLAEA